MGNIRVSVIGLDAATLRLIRPWVDQGKLPNFAQLMKEGTFGVLESVIRPGSPQAWSSFMTGKNPGKHGIFNFIERVPNTYDIRFVNARSRAGESIWKILGRSGKRVCVMNVPITYPPEAVNGVFMSGLDSPGVESEFTFPPSLYKEIRQNVGEYLIEAGMWGYITGGRYSEGLERLEYVVEQRYKVAEYLYNKERWDFFMMVFTAPDRVEHNFWRFMDPSHPLFSKETHEKYGDAIERIYVRLDKKIGEFLKMVDEDTVVMLMSDHGMGKNTDKAFYLNKFLEAKGFLTFKDSSNNRIVSKVKRLVLVDGLKQLKRQIWKRFSRKTKERVIRLFPKLGDKMTSMFLFSRIDMAATKVYADESRSIIWLNVKGRDPLGTVDPGQYETVRSQVINALEELRDPETGEPVVERAYRREEIYHGSFVTDAPDIVVVWHNDEYRSRPSATSAHNPFMRKLGPDELEKLERDAQANADHRMDGILFLRGPNIKKGYEIDEANIMDLAPTILYLFGLHVPEDIDGKVLVDALEEDYLRANPIRFTGDDKDEEGRGSHQYSEEEAETIRERLQGLGYL